MSKVSAGSKNVPTQSVGTIREELSPTLCHWFAGIDLVRIRSFQNQNKAMSKLYDVIIIGCGPAGATAALLLAAKGMDVAVLDKKSFPRFKLCAGMLTQKTLDQCSLFYPELVHELKKRDIIRHVSSQYAISTGKKRLYTGSSKYSYVLVDRESYDQLWHEKVRETGASVYREQIVRVDIPESRVTAKNGRVFRGRFILGADGGSSRVRKTLALEKVVRPPWSKGSALALETFVSRQQAGFPDFPELFTGIVPDGYAWSFPGASRQRLGICSAVVKDGRELRKIMLDLLAGQGVHLDEKEIRGHVLPYGDYEKTPGFQNILLLGDAAGMADPLLGEGIYYAHATGGLAARAVEECWSRNDRTADVYSSLLSDIIRDMRIKWFMRKAGLGLLPLLQLRSLRPCLDFILPRLEHMIHKR